MELTEELKKIKKIYGEKFMHLCRNLFPAILEIEGRLLEILSKSFGNNSRTLYQDIVDNGLEEELKNFVYSKIDMEDSDKRIITNKTPYELLDEAGYELFECKSEEEIQSFKKYYAPGEALCTFNGGRLNRCEVFFAVRKDVDEIRREDYSAPKREDRYGTSVMGIQFNKEGLCTVSIKNRYNHKVNNPDATYGNDLERIVPGLTQSFAELLAERGLSLNSRNKERFHIPGYVFVGDGRYYKYNMEIDGVYYCPGNIVIENGQVIKLKDNELLIDNFVLDTKEKTLKEYRKGFSKDSFVDAFTDIDKIDVTKNKEKGTRTITVSVKDSEHPITIEINENNEMTEYSNQSLRTVENSFLHNKKGSIKLELPELQSIGDDFLYHNTGLSELEFPQLKSVGDDFLYRNTGLSKLELPQLQKVGNNFLSSNIALTRLELSQLQKVGNGFLHDNTSISELELPRLQTVGDRFLFYNSGIKEIRLPQLQTVGKKFLFYNIDISELELPQLQTVGSYFLNHNISLRRLELSQLKEVKDAFLSNNTDIGELELPQLQTVGSYFLLNNKALREIRLPQLQTVGDNFLPNNTGINKIDLPQLRTVGAYFLGKSIGKKNAINFQNIAELDKSTELMTSEVGWGARIIGKIKTAVRNMFSRNSDKDSR